jgi:hypothetical protein
MEYKDIVFEPLNDVGANELDIVNEHEQLLNNNDFDDAATLLSSTKTGFKASLFNYIQERLRALEVFILNEFVAEQGEYYSYNEPNIEEMPEDAVFFIQITK